MKVTEILEKAKAQGVYLELKDDNLVLKSSQKSIAPDLLNILKKEKSNIIDFLKKHDKRDSSLAIFSEEKVKSYDRTQHEHIPLSFSQEGLWFLDQLQGSTEYHIPFILQLSGDLDITILSASFKEIINRHEALRTVIYSKEGVGSQKLLSSDDWQLSYQNLSNKKEELSTQVDAFLAAPFDLSADYMLRVSLYDLGDKEYVLTGVLHHISSDGWSVGILVNEFMELYSALSSNRPVTLPILSLQYTDYAIWQRKYLEGKVINTQLSYWEKKLQGVATLQLPTDYVRPSIQSVAGASIEFDLSTTLSNRIKALSKKEGVTVFMTLLCSLKILLSKYSGQEDICIGTPVANRTQAELEGMIGFFINTLALRSKVTNDISFKKLLQEVKQMTLEAYEHQQTPFDKVVERVVTTRNLSITPLFQVMFILQNTPDSADTEMNGLTISDYKDQKHTTSRFDMTMNVAETNTGFSINIEYCTDLFTKETIEKMTVHYKELLEDIVKNSSKQIGNLSILTNKEQHQLLNTFNTTKVELPKDQTIVDLLANQVKKTPKAIAIVCKNEHLTYEELDKRSNQLAHYLINKGIVSNNLVGISIHRSLEMLVGVIAILKAGGAYVSIDPKYPASRINYMLEDSGATIFLSNSTTNIIGFSPKNNLDIILLDSHWASIAKEPAIQIKKIPSPEDLAYVIYTSGSTGKPKGVMIAHKNTVSLIQWAQKQYSEEQLSGMLASTSLSFDLSVFELFTPLTVGGSVYLVEDLFALSEVTLPITFINTVPSVLKSYIASHTLPNSVTTINLAGEPLSKNLVNILYEIDSNFEVNDLYGPSEYTTYATFSKRLANGLATIGKPISNTTIYILNDNESLVPIGVIGELCIAGNQLTKGYLNKPDLTAEKFVLNPFKKGEHMYKTGDLARWLPDGNLEFLGRKDDQVKIRGYRIELGEIEHVLSSITEVEECYILATEDINGTKRLVGYVVLKNILDKEHLQEHLKRSLPEYMVPMLWVKLDKMPLTNNGKIDKKALPSIDTSELSSKVYLAPQTETEKQLASIWQDLLGIEKVGVHDNFFELGGHSLLAIRLVSIIRKELEVEITIRDVFIHNTIATLNKYLGTLNKDTLVTVINIQEKPKHIPLSFSQERLWFLDQLQVSLEYHMPFVFRLSGDLDIKILSASFHEIVNRHEVLRTVMYSEKGVGYQKIMSSENWKISFENPKNEEELSEQIETFLSNPFDLSVDYMLRIAIYDLGNKEYVLAGVFHHISSDGWSIDIFINDFITLYNTIKSGRSVILPELSLQYTDYAIWQRTYIEGTVMNTQLSYWEEQLQGATTLQLPTDFARPSIQSTSGSSIVIDLNTSLSSSIKSLSKKEGVTPFMTLLTVFKVLLSKYSGQEDICVGTPVANRTQAELEGMIGFFVNTLVLRSKITKNVSFIKTLQDVKQMALEAYDHQQVPFEKVVEHVVTTRDMSMSPLFQVMFTLQNTPESTDVEMEGLTLSDYEGKKNTTSKFDLTINITETKTGFSISIEYCTDLFKEETIYGMSTHYQELLKNIVAFPSKKLSDFSMLSKEEEHQLLNVFNPTPISLPKDKTIVDLFVEQVQKSPNAIAVIFEETKLTYKELDIKSNQFAHYLLSKYEVVIEDLIGVKLDQSEWSIISILAILKIGGAYLPIDLTYPQQRIDYIEKDSCCKTVIDENFISSFKKATIISNKLPKLINNSNHLAYVMYTSGSTGKPKGVMVEHKNIIRLVKSANFYQLNETDILLSTGSFSFDAVTFEYWGTLLNGARLILCSKDTLLNSSKLSNEIKTHNVNIMWFTSGWMNQIVDDLISLFSPLSTVLVGGDKLSSIHIDKLRSKYPLLEIINGYGPTENTTFSLTHTIKEVNNNIPIGIPISNSKAYIVSESLELQAIGVIGEICLGGLGVSRGYLNQPGLTNEKFINSPFVVGERIYKTGDLGRWLPNGQMEFVGRKDDQVKIRGHRIELGEIEYILSSITTVLQSCVLVKEDNSGVKRLIGYVVLNTTLDKEYLQEQLKESLPAYMVPSLWIELEKLPLTSNGKIDKKALPDPDNSALSSTAYVAPKTNIEKQLVIIWQDLLGVEKIGTHDNFFELGGHSLLIVRLISRIQNLGYTIDVRDIFSDPSIALLSKKFSTDLSTYKVPANGIEKGCAYITPTMVPLINLNQGELETIMDEVSGSAVNIQDIYPLSPLQEGIHFHHLMNNSSLGDPYILPFLLEFSSTEKRSAFIKALNFVISRHDVLRTCVLNSGLPEAVQVVLRNVTLPIEVLEINKKQEILTQVEKEIAPENLWMDLSQAPMIRLKTADDIDNNTYYLVFNYHHLIMDHVGLEKVIEEIMVYSSGEGDELPTPALYRNFIGDALNKNRLIDSENYFRSLFKGIVEPTYPFNLSNTLLDGSAIITSSKIVLPTDLSNTIRNTSSRLKISPAILFHAAFGLVIGRCSNKDYAIFGSLFLGRLQGSEGSETSLGLFINTLPVLLSLKGNTLEYINHTTTRLQEYLSYEQTALSNIQQWSEISNDVSIFSALLNYRHSSSEASSNTDIDLGVEVVSIDERTNYPLNLDIDDFGDDFLLTSKIARNDIDAANITAYMEEALTLLLIDLETDTPRKVNELSILPEKEKQQLLEVFNDTSVDYPLDKTIVDLFVSQASKTPNAIAGVYNGEELTYAILDEKSNQLARYLITKGIQQDTLVGICLERGLDMLIGVLGTLKSGGAYVPIDPQYPKDRIDYIVEDTNLNFLISNTQSFATVKNDTSLELILLDTDWLTISKEDENTFPTICSPNNLAYVIYTSGSTGKPKGAMIPHKGMLNHLLVMVDEFEMDTTTSIAFTAPFTFDISVWQLLSGLISGGKIVIYSKVDLLNPVLLQEKLYDDGITILQLVPSYLSELLEIETSKNLRNLRYFLVTGEAVHPSILNRWFDTYPNIPVVNAYGPAEASDDVTLYTMHSAPDSANVSIGKPIANTTMYVLDEKENLLPIGVTGELCVGGVGLGRGYLNRSDLTAEKFVPNPFKKGERMYKTGDLGRWLPDGNLEFLGRKDDQVKIRGHRIELGEIENFLSSITNVEQCCVLAKEDVNGVNRLVGYVVLKDILDKEYLQKELKQSLPEYMVPMLWVELDEMPLTPNGKVDKKSLPDPDASDLSSTAYRAPRTTIEEQLVVIWQNLLGIAQVGIDDNFFELGGHSLLAVRLVSMIRKELEIEITIQEVFKNTTIVNLSDYLSKLDKGTLLPTISVQEKPARIPLSFSQERLWFLDQLQGSLEYHMPFTLRFSGNLNISILAASFKEIINRHEILRTVIYSENGIGYQKVLPIDGWELSYENLTEEKALLPKKIDVFLSQPFDLSTDYMLRLCVYDLGAEDYVLAGVFHHISSDGWSDSILVNEFMELYNSLNLGLPSTLPPLPLQYADYALWQRKYLEGVVLNTQLSYWEKQLQGVNVLQLPTDYTRPPIKSNSGSLITFDLDTTLSNDLNSLSQQEGVTIFMTLLASFKVLLSKYSNQEDICVGTPVANRTQVELEGIIGFFVNTLVLRSTISNDTSFQEVLQDIKQTTLEAYDHQQVSFEKVVDRVVTTRDMSTTPLFQVMFVLQNIPESDDNEIEELSISNYEDQRQVASKFDLSINIIETDAGFSINIQYCTDLFTEDTIQRMATHYQELLKAIIISPSEKLHNLSMLTNEEEHQLLNIFNDVSVDYPLDKTVIDLFEEQVKKTPNATAIIYKGETISYKNLDKKSNQLGGYLRAKGVKPDDLVGICLERSLDMIIGVFGILKSGGAYVPIEPEYPKDRVDYIIEDASIKLVLSNAKNCKVLKEKKGLEILLLDSDWDNISKFPSASLSKTLLNNNLVYVIYTSGTTGKPKGVLIEHKALIDYFWGIVAATNILECNSFALISTLAADGGNTQIFGALSIGACLHIFSKEELTDGKNLVTKNIDFIKIIPSFWKVLQQNDKSFIPNKCLMFGGEQLPLDILDSIGSNYQVYNHYGPTETTIGKLIKKISFEDNFQKSIPLGTPFGNTKVFILDSHHNICPIGIVGELFIAGDGLARGYLNREELTNKKFISNPFGKEGELMYSTGDLVRWLPNGDIDFLGRKDDQIKIRGYRIELGEIENALSLITGIKQCSVLLHETDKGDKRLVGYVIQEKAIDKIYIQEQLKLSLPEYMIPMLWIELEEMPLTSNGKINKKSLPNPDVSDLSSTAYIAPKTPIEELLVVIWQNLLGIKKVGIHDDFFELGGHSLLAVRLVSMIRKELEVEMMIRDIFTYLTIAKLSDYIITLDKGILLPMIHALEKPERIPLSFSQERLWFMDQLQGSVEYHIPFTLRLSGDINISVLAASFKEIVNRHEILRTVIHSEDGIGYQKILPVNDWELSYEDFTEKDQVLSRELNAFLSHPFDLSTDYMLRLCVYDLGNKEYVLAGVFHHIASDGWSESILVSEFMELYTSLNSNHSPTLPPLSVQYADYALWQRKYLEGAVIDTQLSYWEKQLQGVNVLQLPTDYARPAIQSTAGAISVFDLDVPLSTSIKSLSQSEGVTVFMTLLSSFKVLLSKYSRQEDICVGTSVANRMQVELENMFGFFVNTLALRSTIKNDISFKEVLQNVKQMTLDAYDHQQVPFEKIVERVEKSRDRSMSPLFQVMFVLQNTPSSEEAETNGFSLSGYEDQEHSVSPFDLTMNVVEMDTKFTISIEYCTDLFSKDTIDRMIANFQDLLKSIVSDISQPIGNLSMLAKKEKQQLLEVFNNTTLKYPEEKTIVSLFTEQVLKTPNAIAVVFEGEELTYTELDEKSDRLAYYLKTENKIEPEDIVGILLDRSIWAIVSMLGILKSGACYLPIDKEYPDARKVAIIEDSKLKLLIIEVESLFEVIEYGVKIFSIDVEFENLSKKLETNPVINPSHLAYIIYTSGSTGKPKGVMIEHKNILNTILAQIPAFSIEKNDRCLQFASLSFDASVSEIFTALLSGSSLCIIKEATKSDTTYFKNFIATHFINILTLPPAFLQLLAVEDLKGIKTLVTAGESISLELAKRFSNHYNYVNAYGPTETSICATTFNENITDVVPIGKPISNTQVYIMNENHRLLPIGVVGELCVAGAGVARGYLNKEDLTAEKFIANPFKKQERVYKTGDLARWLPNGNLEFLGRKDNQVKIRGYRIELGEVENALSLIPEVDHCCILAKKDTGGSNRLVGYVVVSDPLDKDYLEESLKQNLPTYMVPTLWVALEELPVTNNGKTDKESLPEPEESDLSSNVYIAPTTTTEKQLVVIWQDLLAIEKIGINDDFFELGGHSLLAVRLVSMIRKKFNIEIEIQDVFIYPSVFSLGNYLATLDTGTLLPMVSIQERPTHIPLSFSQERLWFLDQLQGSLEYHMPFVLRLSGDLDTAILATSFKEIVNRHEILRTVIYSKEGTGYQKILSPDDWQLSYEDLSNKKEELSTQVDAFLATPFDLSADYMFRLCVYDLGDKEYVLSGVFHHISNDGWSTSIFVNEFIELYNALNSNRPIITLPALPLQYADYALWQRKHLEGQVIDTQLSYWEKKLQGLATLQLPTDYPRTTTQSISGASTSFDLNTTLSDQIKTLSKNEGVTVFMTLLSSFKILLSKYSGQEDICVGTPIANRTQAELEGMIGFFVNTLALRSIITNAISFKELLQEVKQMTLEAYDHQQVSFEKIVERVTNTRNLNISPLFQVMFMLHNTPESKTETEINGLTLSNYEEQKDTTSQFDLTMSIIETDSKFSIGIEYCTDLFTEETIKRMAVHYKELLENIVKDTNKKIGDLSILTNEEEHQLLNIFNDTEVLYPKDKTVVDLFDEQVKKTPKAIAIVYKNEHLTYDELDKRSNQLAHYLINKGVTTNSLVGISIHRSLEMLVGVIAILKAGATYVPIDPNYPTSRISYMLEDSKVTILLSNSTTNTIGFSRKDDLDIILLDSHWSSISKESAKQIKSIPSPEDLAYIIYTSGSTGKPKGVMIAHKNTTALIQWTKKQYNTQQLSGMLASTSLSFDLSVFELFTPLAAGGTIYLVEDLFSLSEVAFPVTFINTVPSVLKSYIASYSIPNSVTTINLAGEPLSQDLVNTLYRIDNNFEVNDLYGPSEYTTYATFSKRLANGLTTIGKPISNTRIYILNENENLVPLGVIGELCISGNQLTKGYLNKPDLTAEKFILNPFNKGECMYKTGDLARWLPDGNIEFLGRKDDQIKIRGYRIELGEVTNALSSITEVQECYVLAKEDANGTKNLISYVVLDNTLDKEYLQEQLKLSLPKYMVPMLWVELDEMPLTNNGKIDTKALPSIDTSELSSKIYVAPKTIIEKQLVSIWQDLLGIEKVGIHDNFFELGGHSLLVVKLVASINKLLNTNTRIMFLFEHPTISQFIKNMYSESSLGDSILIPLQKAGTQKPIFLTPPEGGTVTRYIELAKSLGNDQPVYGFQCPGLDGASKVSSSIEEMASEFIKEMQKVDLYGPYRIGGYSFGALIAYEIAHQLQQNGYDIDELLIFDGQINFENTIKIEDIDQDDVFRHTLYDEINEEVLGEEFNKSDLVLEGKSKEEQMETVLEYLKKIKFKMNPLEIRKIFEVKSNNALLGYSYFKDKGEKKLDTKIILFRAMYSEIEKDGKMVLIPNTNEIVDYGWSKHTLKEVIVHLIPAHHMSLLDNKHIEKIVKHLNNKKEIQNIIN